MLRNHLIGVARHLQLFRDVSQFGPIWPSISAVRAVSNSRTGGFRAVQQRLADEKMGLEDPSKPLRRAIQDRAALKNARRIIVKVGSAVITRDGGTLAASRLASIVEQVAELQLKGKEIILVTSGAVAFGKKKIGDEVMKTKSIRETLNNKKSSPNLELVAAASGSPITEPPADSNNRAAAAVGQSSLMSFYESIFSQYDCKVAQVLVTKADFLNDFSRKQLRSTMLDLLSLNIVPIVNTNDAVEAAVTSDLNKYDRRNINVNASMLQILIEDNDSLASILAVELQSDLMILLSNVDGIYTGPPGKRGSRFLPSYGPRQDETKAIEFGDKSNVGLGGMQSKVKSALWALSRGTSVVICNGNQDEAISAVLKGQRIGTFFTESQKESQSIDLAAMARKGGSALRLLSPQMRSAIIRDIAELLQERKELILSENERDLLKAEKAHLDRALMSRLSLTPEKLNSLSDGLQQIAEASEHQLNRVIKRERIADGMILNQITCPIGQLLVIFESRPDCLPQIAALSIGTANSLLAKGGKEAQHSNECLWKIIQEALAKYSCQEAIQLIDSRERVSELVALDKYIDLIIPRGSNQLVRSIQEQSKTIPVLGHAEGVCHVYVDRQANVESAVKIVIDSKCDYPAACNAMETLLVHRSLITGEDGAPNILARLCRKLQDHGVKINAGPQLARELPFYPPVKGELGVEYGSLECTIEVVDSVNEAIDFINTYGSGHTDAIVTDDDETAKLFITKVESASVMRNCSTRFADGYRYGLGAEVGISTSKIHARGPVGMDGLLTYKWILEGSGDAVAEYEKLGRKKYGHETLNLAHNELYTP